MLSAEYSGIIPMVALRRRTAVMKAASNPPDQERDHYREQEDADSGAWELAPGRLWRFRAAKTIAGPARSGQSSSEKFRMSLKVILPDQVLLKPQPRRCLPGLRELQNQPAQKASV